MTFPAMFYLVSVVAAMFLIKTLSTPSYTSKKDTKDKHVVLYAYVTFNLCSICILNLKFELVIHTVPLPHVYTL